MFVFCECSVLYTYRPVRRADTPSRGIAPSVHVECDQVQHLPFTSAMKRQKMLD